MISNSNFGTDYNPAQVMLNAGSGGPYLKASTGITGNPINGGTFNAPTSVQSGGPTQVANGNPGYAPIQQYTMNPESVRASGTGPFDSAYRQNLATYAGGQFQRPGGNLSFNPTSTSLFGNPTGGGNDPVLGMGNSLLSLGLGGQPAAFSNPNQNPSNPNMGGNQLGGSLMDWLKQLNQFGIGNGNGKQALPL